MVPISSYVGQRFTPSNLFPLNVAPRMTLVLLNGCVVGFFCTLDLLSAPVSAGRELAGTFRDGGGIS
jgi:hypothetical protein